MAECTRMVKERLSVVIPCYNSEKNIRQVLENAKEIFEKNGIRDYEFILVNDCSKDDTHKVITELANTNDNVIAIDLARNSGQHGALMAGFQYVSGEYVVTCEDDGQTQIEMAGKMLECLRNGADVAVAKYVSKEKKTVFRNLGTKMARLMSTIMLPAPKGMVIPIFFMAKRFVIEEMKRYQQAYPYVTGLVGRTTQNIAVVEASHLTRNSGTTGYTFKKLLKLWMNGFTAFSVKPLRLSFVLSGIMIVLSFIYGIVSLIRKFALGAAVGEISLLLFIVLLLFGIVFAMMGMMGEYIGRIYMCMNSEPQYVVRNVVGIKEDDERQ